MFDFRIKNARVIDGTGGPSFRGDILLRGDRIADVRPPSETEAARTLDAGGQVVAPGFIDMHSHGDFTLPACPAADSLVHQGVTTAVVGQCGFSLAPLLPSTRQEVITSLETRKYPIPWEKWSDFGSYLEFMESLGLGVNVVPLVGQGTIRAGIMGFVSGRADSSQMNDMREQVEKALAQGAWGISTGLIYPPGSYASTEELVELVRPVGRAKGFYFTHLRSEGEGLLQAMAEAIRIGRETGAAVQIGHLKAGWPANWEKQAGALDLIEKARREGLDIHADVYPYLAGATSLKSILPQWAQEGGKKATLERLKNPGLRRKIAADMKTDGLGREASWDRIRISRSGLRPEYAGRFVSELAAAAKKSPEEWVFDALLESDLDMGMLTFMISEENLKAALRHPAVMIGSDSTVLSTEGPLAQGAPHPRAFGTFPRVFGRYVREEKVLSLEEAVSKMSGLPAGRLGLADRGFIRPGCRADLVIFDPESIRDQATFESPFRYAAGISHVFCNGRPVIAGGRMTGERPGRVLRRKAAG
ncbi:MAG: D-aminoacylase [Syntrophaceae bacterium]|nr:D-aminoacylase [Syntrophaceae bacterium]